MDTHHRRAGEWPVACCRRARSAARCRQPTGPPDGETSLIEAVVFDLDGVLCHYRIERRLALLSSWSGRAPDAIHAAIWRSGFEDAAERGIVSADDYLKGFGERIGYALSAAQWIEARRTAIEPDEHVLAIARRLGAERPV